MSTDHAAFAEWDAAYVLGALSPADRRAFEEHLESCDRCVRAVASIAPTLGLMARIDRTRAEALLAGDPAGDADGPVVGAAPVAMRGVEDLLARAARDRRHRRTRWSAGLAAAAVVVVAVVVAVSTAIVPALRGIRTADLVDVADVPLTASVEFVPAAWGTRIELECRYLGDGGGEGAGRPYVLVVVDRDGAVSEVSSWRASPGATARLDAATALEVGEIAAVEIRPIDSDVVLMRADFAVE